MRAPLLAVLLVPILGALPSGAARFCCRPGEQAGQVRTAIFLVSLNRVTEPNETFEADLYLSFRWCDSRLSFEGPEPRRFLEDAAVTRLRACGGRSSSRRPATPSVTNRLLEIALDGGCTTGSASRRSFAPASTCVTSRSMARSCRLQPGPSVRGAPRDGGRCRCGAQSGRGLGSRLLRVRASDGEAR